MDTVSPLQRSRIRPTRLPNAVSVSEGHPEQPHKGGSEAPARDTKKGPPEGGPGSSNPLARVNSRLDLVHAEPEAELELLLTDRYSVRNAELAIANLSLRADDVEGLFV